MRCAGARPGRAGCPRTGKSAATPAGSPPGPAGQRELRGDHVPVHGRDQAAQLVRHLLAGDLAEPVRLRGQVRGQCRRALLGRAELLDVLRPHPGHPVQARRPGGRHPGQRGGGQAAAGQQRRAGQRVRPAAGPADGDELVRAQVVQHAGRVGHGVGHARGRAAPWTGRSRAGRTSRCAARVPRPRRSSGGTRPARRGCRCGTAAAARPAGPRSALPATGRLR